MSVGPPSQYAAPRDALLLNQADHVATALRALGTGHRAHVEGLKQTLLIRQDIPLCHKVACRDIAAGEAVRKSGEHVHNLKSQRS